MPSLFCSYTCIGGHFPPLFPYCSCAALVITTWMAVVQILVDSIVDKRLFADSQKAQKVSGYISIVRICLLYIDIKIILY